MSKSPPYGLSWRSNTFFIVATVGIGLFTDLFLYGLVVPILPSILRDKVGEPPEKIQKDVSALLTVYAAASVITSPFAGILADRLPSRQLPFLAGLLALLLATVLLFVGTTIPVLAVARILQGVSAAFVWTIGLALCLETVGAENLGKTIGSIFSFVSVGSLCAPLVGGTLYEKTGYAGVFGVAFALIAVDFTMRALVIEKKVAEQYLPPPKDSDSDSDSHSASGSDAEPGLLSQDQRNDINEPSSSTHNEQPANPNETQPLLDRKTSTSSSQASDPLRAYKLPPNQPTIARLAPILPCLASPRLLTALLAALVQAILLGSFDATIPTVANQYFNFDSLRAGLLFLPLGASDLLLGPAFGWVIDKYGVKVVAVGSYALLVPALTLLRIPAPGGEDQQIIYGVLLGFCGVGLAGIGAPGMVEAGAVVEKYYQANPEFFDEKGKGGPYAQLYGLQSMVFSAGLAIGPELAGQLREAIGYGNMNAVLAAVCGVTAMLCFVFLGGKPGILKGRGRGRGRL